MTESDDLEESLRTTLEEKFFPDAKSEKLTGKLGDDGDQPMQHDQNQIEDDGDKDHLAKSNVDTVQTSYNSSDLTRSQRKRQKKREFLKLKRAAKATIPKPKPQDPPTSSSIVLPTTKRYVSELDTDEKRLKAACVRLAETNNYTLQIRPIPRPCPPGLLKDLCPLAIGIRFPAKTSSRYAFVQFRNNEELVATQNFLSTKLFNGKPLKIIRATSELIPDKSNNQWHKPSERQLSDFKWNVLFVTHLPRATTRFDLAQVFCKATSINMPTFDDGSCKGFCTLTYRTKKAALQAFETRHGTFVRGSSIYVNFALKSRRKPSKQINKRPLDDNVDANHESYPASKITRTEVFKTNTKDSQSSDTFDPSFVIQSSVESQNSNLPRKRSKVATKLPNKPHPKLTAKHQLKCKSTTKQTNSSALDALLKPPVSSTKKDRFKSKSKKSKSNKHR